jgi:hypothetical protein
VFGQSEISSEIFMSHLLWGGAKAAKGLTFAHPVLNVGIRAGGKNMSAKTAQRQLERADVATGTGELPVWNSM